MITVFLERGANVHGLDEHERTPSRRAVEHGYWEVVPVLLKAGADAEADIDELSTREKKRIRRLVRRLGGLCNAEL